MDKSGKIWGSTSKIFTGNNVEIHRIIGKKGGISSMHAHVHKHSMFYVECGSIAVEVEKNEYKLTDRTILHSGESTILRPSEYHRFEVLENATVCYEIYWVELDPDDIVRRDVGTIKATRPRKRKR